MDRTSEPESLRMGIGVEEILALDVGLGCLPSTVTFAGEPLILRLARGGPAQDDKCWWARIVVAQQLLDRQPVVAGRPVVLAPYGFSSSLRQPLSCFSRAIASRISPKIWYQTNRSML